LGLQYAGGFDVFANDGVVDADGNVCMLCSGVCGWVGGSVEDLSRDGGARVRRCRRVIERWVGCKAEEGTKNRGNIDT
jgi:hypothetical protein